MPAPVIFTSTEQGDATGHVFATQEIVVGGTTMHVAGGQELFGQPNFGNGTGTITSATTPHCLNDATTGVFSSEKTLAAGCSRLLVKSECSVDGIDVKMRIWWQDSSGTTKAWFPGVMGDGSDELWVRATGVSSNIGTGDVPGYRTVGYHLTSAFVPVQGAKFKIELVNDGGSSNVVSVWAEGI